MEGDQPFQSHSHAQQPLQPQTCVEEHCPGKTGLPSSLFQAVNKMSLVVLFYFSMFWITHPVWVYREENNAGSISKGWI